MKLKEIKFGKLNVLDIAIVLIVIVCVGVFGLTRLNSSKEGTVATGNNSVSSKFTYTISIKGISETSRDMLKVGDEVYDKVSNTYIGKIKDLIIAEAQGTIDKENGEVVVAKMPGKIDVDLIIETDGTIKNGEYLANGLIRIMVGNFKEIKTKYLMCAGTVYSIER